MFLKAGALSVALLLASRLLGLARESAQAAAFGTSGLADVAVLMLTLPDWLAGVLASGALAYVLVPAWAGKPASEVAASQRRLAWALLAAGTALALLLAFWRVPVVGWLAGGLPPSMLGAATSAMVWSAMALPAALLAALWSTRLQHERDFVGMYGANLVVNVALIGAIAWVGLRAPESDVVGWLGAGLLAAMLLRLIWLRWREPATPHDLRTPESGATALAALPALPVWLWAALSAGLPLVLPFVARSMASRSGEGALATFNYAWKLVELPTLLAIQVVATLALPAIARAFAQGESAAVRSAVRGAFALAWSLACAAAAALLLGAPAIASLLFGWGRVEPEALARVAQWGALGAWGLLPQAVIAVSLAVLAARGRMRIAVLAYGAAVGILLLYAETGGSDGGRLMVLLNVLQLGVATILVVALGAEARAWLPVRAMVISLLCLLALAAAALQLPALATGWVTGLALAAVAAALVLAATWWGSGDLRAALAR
jgi:putative peptidoglycan lipid II flippase